MGTFAPEEGEFVRIVLELKGRKGLTQKEYNEYMAEIRRIVYKYGAEFRVGEHVKIEDQIVGHKKRKKKKR